MRRSVQFSHALLFAFVLFAGDLLAATPVYGYKVVARYPHSTDSFTEGFFYLNGLFYESTGLNGHSSILVIEPKTGKPLQQQTIPPQYFGEGIVDFGPNILEWTWQTHAGFVFDRFSLRQVATFTYAGEGWGMTRTDKEIVTSDGSSTLRFRNPKTFAEARHIDVHDGAKEISQLNELELVKGEIYANVWHEERIARISPKDGHVLGWIDLTGLLPDDEKVNAESVLNGIAYDAKGDRLFVTGKHWPAVFEIKLVPPGK
ncbi:Glutamine cyclotransferase [Granulicella rosea]|uniref:Glutamine cyclotransferase n=1 Tax=Granulicella rosea TaxID=474952 RepID=A0A239DGE1_9BACT|nr:glutaminyl-peptide cyclotransferase [Granulicella rosea]SNS30951.1 Glutamine cyclotransferase [Granulicella rosea]